LLGVWAAAAGIVLLAWAVGAFANAELGIDDAHFSVRGKQSPDRKIVLVLIDPRSLNAIDVYPFPRRLHAEVIDRLHAAGAAVIAYDVVFAERGPRVTDDNDLLEAIERAGNVVVAADATDDRGRPDALSGDPAAVRATAGDSDFELDPGGVYRRVTAEVNGLQSFAVAVVRRSGEVSGGSLGRQGKSVTAQGLAGHGEPIDFAGPAGTYRSVSFSDVLSGRIPDSVFRGQIVVVGASDPTLQDVHPTPTSVAMPGAEIQANAIATVVAGVPLRFAPGWLGPLMILILSGVAPVCGICFGARLGRSVPVTLLAVGGYVVASQLVFNWGWIVPVAGPVTGLLVTLPLLAAIDFVTAGYEHGVEAERHAAELGEARRHALAAADTARRQIERDIHDGAQQQILAVALTLSHTGEDVGGTGSGELGEILNRSAARLLEAVRGLRTLARGSYPPTLIEGGLDAAIESLVNEMPGLVRIAGRIGCRLPVELEAVCYFCVSESLANALKHSQATEIEIGSGTDGTNAWVEVRDDGVGGADPEGHGLAGLRERVDSVDGHLLVTSRPGDGTTVRVELALDGDRERPLGRVG
jgi:CHASE2 domain-containing sensor protein